MHGFNSYSIACNHQNYWHLTYSKRKNLHRKRAEAYQQGEHKMTNNKEVADWTTIKKKRLSFAYIELISGISLFPQINTRTFVGAFKYVKIYPECSILLYNSIRWAYLFSANILHGRVITCIEPVCFDILLLSISMINSITIVIKTNRIN